MTDRRARAESFEKGSSIGRTETIADRESVKQVIIDFTNRANRIDRCGGVIWPSVIMGIDDLRESFEDFIKRGGKARCIAEITSDNLVYCKQLMQLGELRHLTGMKGSFAINDKGEYIAAATLQRQQTAGHLIHSTSITIVEQQQYVFELLWKKAIPAEQRIREIEEGIEPTATKVIEEPEEIVKRAKEVTESSKWLSICSTGDWIEKISNTIYKSLKKILQEKEKGNHNGIRWIGPIHLKDLETVKFLLKEGIEFRHIDYIPINFSVTDKHFNFTVEGLEDNNGNGFNAKVLISNDKIYVDHFNTLFERLWKNGTDANSRINQIEESVKTGQKEQITEIIRNSDEFVERMLKMTESTKDEIMLLLSSTKNFGRSQRIGAFDLYNRLIEENKTNIRILISSPHSKEAQSILSESQRIEEATRINEIADYMNNGMPKVKFGITDRRQIKDGMSILLKDSKEVLVWETIDDTKENVNEAVGLSIYSNSKPIVLSYHSIFESLWTQTEMFEQLTIAHQKLENHEKRQQEFINIAAHEIRTPTQKILGFLEMAEAYPDERIFIGNAYTNAVRLTRLTQDLLDAARIESNTLRLNIEKIELNELVLSIIRERQNLIDEETKSSDKGINREKTERQGHGSIRILFTRVNYEGSLYLYADKTKLTQAISNLLENAVEFTKEGAINVIVEKGYTHDEIDGPRGKILVKIKDSGTGIDPKVLDRLFDKFTTTSHKGTGLGLYIAKSIIEAHGGRIWAENNPEGGATFSFTLRVITSL